MFSRKAFASLMCLLLLCGCAPQQENVPSNEIPKQETQQSVDPEAPADHDPSEDIKAFLLNTYAEEEIIRVKVTEVKSEVSILSDVAKGDEAPENWDVLRADAEGLSNDILAMLTESGQQFSVVYLVDANNEILLSVSNGKTQYDTYKGASGGEGYNPPTISLAEFNEIQSGMEYQEVFDIIGSKGKILSETDAGLGDAYYTVMYQWTGEGSVGANASVMFQGGKVINKSQIGLA